MSEGYWESSKVNNFIKLQGYTLKKGKLNLLYFPFSRSETRQQVEKKMGDLVEKLNNRGYSVIIVPFMNN